MSNLVGRVHFKAEIDGDRMPSDAQRVGREAGLLAGKGFNEKWDAEFRKGLTATGKQQLAHWKKRGSADGLTYGAGLEDAFRKYSTRLNDAFSNFQGLQIDSSFLDEYGGSVRGVEHDINGLQEQMDLLHRQGGITDAQYRKVTDTLTKYAQTQREAAINADLDRVAQERQAESMRELRDELAQHERARRNVIAAEDDHRRSLVDLNREWQVTTTLTDRVTLGLDKQGNSIDGLSMKWGDLSHNTRQWTLIIGAVTAAIPELAGLASAAGSGLFVLGGAATSAGIGVGTLISSIVGLNGDIDKLPDSLRPARAGLDDFKNSFSDLNSVITQSAFLNSEQAWRSLGATVRGLSPAFAKVGGVVGDLLQDLSTGVAPGTHNFQNLSRVVENSAHIFDRLARAAGRVGEGILDAFANPAMERSVSDLTGWIEDLSDTFADFLEGPSFDDWLRHGTAVFGAFGDLLSTTGGLLNDLVTDASINRLTDFMDNIGTFLDTGGRGILEFADQLNVFGLVADLLATIGEALEPLRGPMVELAAAVRDDLLAAFDGLGIVLGALAEIAAPVASGLADIFQAIPPEVVTTLAGIAAGTYALYGALRAIQGAQGAIVTLQGLGTEGDKAASALGKLARGAGLVGAAVAGAAVGFEMLKGLARDIADVDGKVRQLTSSGSGLNEAYSTLNSTASGGAAAVKDWGGALDRLASTQNTATTGVRNLGLAWDEQGQQVLGIIGTLKELDEGMKGLPLDVQIQQFSAYAKEVGATNEQAQAMLNEMTNLKGGLEAAGDATGKVSSEQDLLNAALGQSTGSTVASTAALSELEAQAGTSKDQITQLADTIRGFGNETLTAREAERQFQESIDQVSASVVANGASLDINTEQGRANEKALDDLARAALDTAASKAELTGKEADATAAVQAGRDELIRQLGQFGITGQAAEDYADKLGLIPSNIPTNVQLNGVSQAAEALDNLARARVATITVRTYDQASGNKGRPTNVGMFASGGMLTGPRHILAGEAGPEAIVPLNRALGQVDPSVRWLSAIAQGKSAPPAMASGGIVGGGVTFAPGSIVVQGYFDPRQAAIDVANEVADKVMS